MTIKNAYPNKRPSVVNLLNTGKIDSRLNFSRASDGTILNSSGLQQTLPAQSPRFTFKYDPTTQTYVDGGLILEASSTNYCPKGWDIQYGDSTYVSTDSFAAFNSSITIPAPCEPFDGSTPDVQATVCTFGGNQGIKFNANWSNFDWATNAGGAFPNAIKGIFMTPSGGTGNQEVSWSVFARVNNVGDLDGLRIGPYGNPYTTSATYPDNNTSGSQKLPIAFGLAYDSGTDTFSPANTDGYTNGVRLNVGGNVSGAVGVENVGNSWFRIYGTITISPTSTEYYNIRALRVLPGLSSGGGGVATGVSYFLWAPQLEIGPSTTPMNNSNATMDYVGQLPSNTAVGNRVPERANEDLIWNSPLLNEDNEYSLYCDMSVTSLQNGATLLVGSNGTPFDNTSLGTSFTQLYQNNNILVFDVANENNIGDVPQFSLRQGRSKFIIALPEAGVSSTNTAYLAGTQIDIVSIPPDTTKIAFLRNSWNSTITVSGSYSSIPLPNGGNAYINALYLYDNAFLSGSQAQALLKGSASAAGTIPAPNANWFGFTVNTQPNFDGSTMFTLNPNNTTDKDNVLRTQSNTDVEINWGDGSNNQVLAADNVYYNYPYPGIYNVQVTENTQIIAFDSTNWTDAPKVTEVVRWGEDIANSSDIGSGAQPFSFQGMSNCTTFPTNIGGGILTVDTSSKTSFAVMFKDCSSMLRPPVFDISSATALNSMFNNCSSMVDVAFGSAQDDFDFPTTQEWTATNLFNGCVNLNFSLRPGWTTGRLPAIDFSECTNTNSMFKDCTQLLDIHTSHPSGMDWGKVNNSANAFSNCSNISRMVALNNFPNASTTNIAGTFSRCKGINGSQADINTLSTAIQNPITTGNVTSLLSLFGQCQLMNYPTDSSNNQWDVSGITSFSQTFTISTGEEDPSNRLTQGCWDPSGPNWQLSTDILDDITLYSMYSGRQGVPYARGQGRSWDTARVFNFGTCFQNCGGIQGPPMNTCANVSGAYNPSEPFGQMGRCFKNTSWQDTGASGLDRFGNGLAGPGDTTPFVRIPEIMDATTANFYQCWDSCSTLSGNSEQTYERVLPILNTIRVLQTSEGTYVQNGQLGLNNTLTPTNTGTFQAQCFTAAAALTARGWTITWSDS